MDREEIVSRFSQMGYVANADKPEAVEEFVELLIEKDDDPKNDFIKSTRVSASTELSGQLAGKLLKAFKDLKIIELWSSNKSLYSLSSFNKEKANKVVAVVNDHYESQRKSKESETSKPSLKRKF